MSKHRDPARPGSRTLRLLLVDDSPVTLELISAYLAEQANLEIVGRAGNGESAVQHTVELRPDLVIMDVDMPKMNGIAATRAIKQQPDPPRVIIMSLHDERSYETAALSAGADAFCSKFRIQESLLDIIRSVFPGV